MTNSILKDIGQRLAYARKKAGLTQEMLADSTGLSIKMISAAENGHKAMRPENIIKICDCLSISADYLLKGESTDLNSVAGTNKIAKLSPKQRDVLINILDDYLSLFDE